MTTIGDLICFEADADALADLTDAEKAKFVEWMKGLDAANEKAGFVYGRLTMWQNTGAACWLAYFNEGTDPADALAEDLDHAD